MEMCGNFIRWLFHPDFQRQGVGRALVKDFERQVAQKGGITIMLGSDDENNMTSLANADLYTDLWEQLANIQNLSKDIRTLFMRRVDFRLLG